MERFFQFEAPRSVFQQHGSSMANCLRNELALRLRNKPPETGIFPHQINAVLEAKHFLEDPTKMGTRPALIVAPTGSGKSGIIGMLPFVLESKRTLILTPAPVLSRQIAAAIASPINRQENFFLRCNFFGREPENLERLLPDAHIISRKDDLKAENIHPNRDLIIVNAQRFGGASSTNLKLMGTDQDDDNLFEDVLKLFDSIDLLIVDEAHHYPAPTWKRIVKLFEARHEDGNVVFVTATADRMSDGQLKRICDHKHDAYVITRALLQDYVIRRLEFEEKPDDKYHKMVQTVRGILRKHDEVENRFGHQALVLVKKIDDAHKIAEQFNAALGHDYAVPVVDSMEKMKNEISDFKSGKKYKVAVVCRLLIEGFDNPNISLCVVLRNVGSKLLFEQFVGRCLRSKRGLSGPEPDRTTAVLLSYPKFNQRRMYEELNYVAENDPVVELDMI